MKILTKSLILTAALTLTEGAFSQSINPPVNPGNTANPASINNPNNTLNPINPVNVPDTTNPAVNPDANQTMNGINPRQEQPGPAVSDRDKVSCLSDQQAVIQGDRVICMGRSSQPSSEVVVPRPNTTN